MLQQFTSLAERYTLSQEVLGEGAYGQVKVATCDDSGSLFACKTIQKASPEWNNAERVSFK